jgi:DNA polymerase I-like protein with 3'-5' exonuclease and polymerase domains
MRPDAIGLFWQDIPHKGVRSFNRIQPDIPATGWVRPHEFPRLRDAPVICIDTETKDPNLIKQGPGWARGDGHLVGISVNAYGRSWYFPMRHEVKPEENLDPEHVLAWARDNLCGNQPKIGANLLYDIGWLGEEGVTVNGPLHDVQFAEALLAEAGEVNLDTLGQKYLHKGKETSILYQWSADYYGGQPTEKQRANIYRCPPSLVGPYAEEDVNLPGRILSLQWEVLHREGLLELYDLECRLIPLLIAMRRAGVQIDIPRAEQVRDQLVIHVAGLQKELNHIVGFGVNVDANESLQKAFKELRLPMPVSEEGKPSFTKDTLPLVEHPIGELILKIRKSDKVRSTFIESYLLNSHVNGRIFCTLHPLRGEGKGARSGRFSMSNPNGQNIPSRDEELAPLVRSCFIPFLGHKQWRRYDWDQVEYRYLAHYAVGSGSDALRERYNANPNTDYHVDTQEQVARYTGLTIPRKPIKNFNFGMVFGMGKGKMIRSLTTELKALGGTFKLDGDELYAAYHEAAPYVKATLEFYSRQAQTVGYVTTILNRRSRFDLWEPDDYDRDDKHRPALSYYAALNAYGRIKRAYTHKALNRVLQGSGTGDNIKRAMLLCWESGVYDVIGVPLLTVHDELDHSDVGGNEEAWRYMHHTLEHAIPLRIPMRCKLDIGANWGETT